MLIYLEFNGTQIPCATLQFIWLSAVRLGKIKMYMGYHSLFVEMIIVYLSYSC